MTPELNDPPSRCRRCLRPGTLLTDAGACLDVDGCSAIAPTIEEAMADGQR